MNPKFIKCPPQYVAQFLTPEAIRKFAKDPENDMTEEFVTEALWKGDECFGILDGGALAAYSWYSSKPTRIRPKALCINVDEHYVYMYKGFTHEKYRGQRLHAIGKTIALQAYIAKGLQGMISYVEFDDSDSLKSTRRMGARHFGSIYIVGAFGHYVVHRTRGCRKLGVHVERFQAPPDAPSLDASRPLEAE